MRVIYDGGIPKSSDSLPGILFGLLIVFSFMTGMGGNAGLASAINSTAKTFPDTVVRADIISFYHGADVFIAWFYYRTRNIWFWPFRFRFLNYCSSRLPWRYILIPLGSRYRDFFPYDFRLLFCSTHTPSFSNPQ